MYVSCCKHLEQLQAIGVSRIKWGIPALQQQQQEEVAAHTPLQTVRTWLLSSNGAASVFFCNQRSFFFSGKKKAMKVGVPFLRKINGMGITFKLYALRHRPAVGSSAYGELIPMCWMPFSLSKCVGCGRGFRRKGSFPCWPQKRVRDSHEKPFLQSSGGTPEGKIAPWCGARCVLCV